MLFITSRPAQFAREKGLCVSSVRIQVMSFTLSRSTKSVRAKFVSAASTKSVSEARLVQDVSEYRKGNDRG